MADSAPAGYSGTPLPKKLGIKPDMVFATVNAPPSFDQTLGELPTGAVWASGIDGAALVVGFFTERARLVEAWSDLTSAVGQLGTVWVAWPKRASKVPTDITETTLREDFLPTGWVDVKVCAIDTTWSGLKFVLRKELRGSP